mmetsp:Transcript_39571/g.114538  ORF Transcript_39571/g.114538 Transcript_39571/m.114538 type:complete len:109 (+) Transcript_39571:775-1101(+)
MMRPKMEDASTGCGDRTKIRVSTARQTNDFPTHCVLLGSKFEGHEGGGLEMCKWGSHGVEALSPKVQGNVAKEERLGVGSDPSVFTGAKKKEKGEAEHVGNGHVAGLL